MNILSIGGRYKPTNGGNAKRISTMCEAFCRAGHNVTVMTCDGYSAGVVDEVIENVLVKRYANCDVLTASIADVCAAVRADAVLLHEETYLRKAMFLKLKVPVVYECHAVEPHPNKVKELISSVLRRIYCRPKYVKRVFVLSRNARASFAKKYTYPLNLVIDTPNGLDKASSYTNEMHFGEGESFIYGYSGTLYEFQGVKILLQYAKDILAIAPDVKIMIVGGGPMEEEVREFVADNALELTEQEFYNFVGMCESPPGPIAVNIATYVGPTQAGLFGSIAATLGVVCPSFLIILLVASVLENLTGNRYFKGFLKGVKPVIIGLILSTGAFLLLKLVGVTTALNPEALIVFALLCAVYFLVKKFFKKKLPSIALIGIAAALGIVVCALFNGF